MTTLAARTKLIKPSVTLAIAAKAGKLRAEGVDVVNFSAGEPDFDTPQHIKDAAIEALRKGMTKYTDVKGIEPLREAIAEKHRIEYGLSYRKEDVLVSCGAKHSLYNLLQTVVDPGDEVVIPSPYWVSYSDMALLAGGVPKIIPTSEASGFRMGPADLAAALTPRTRVVMLNSPCNPTGACYDRDELLALARVLEKHDCLILSDDIYEKIVYDGFQFHNLVALSPALRERTIIVNGVSKTYAMTGWRIGYAAAPQELSAAMHKVHQYTIMSAPTMAQAAALEALLHGEEHVERMRQEYDRRRRLIVSGLNQIGLKTFEPQGAFYAFPSIAVTGMSDEEFAEKLLYEEKVAVVPGNAFGAGGEGYLRCSYATAYEKIEEALRRMERFMRRHG